VSRSRYAALKRVRNLDDWEKLEAAGSRGSKAA
jgi:hypothetical protein